MSGVGDPAHISKVADYVDRKMKEASRATRSQSRDKLAILAAMSIASELLDQSGDLDQVQDKVRTRLDDLLARIEAGVSG